MYRNRTRYKTKRVYEDFVNEFGQVIKCGDDVIFVSDNMGPTVREAVYLYTVYWQAPNGDWLRSGPVCRRNGTRIKYVYSSGTFEDTNTPWKPVCLPSGRVYRLA